MGEYIYILSNPSMQGLIKIGKTTISPDKRMSELHSTGVPTPFVLEFSAEVEDCTASEKSAHLALQEYRVSKHREFFRISVHDALLLILPKIGDYEIHKFSSTHNITQIKNEVRKRKIIAERKQAIEKEEREHRILEAKIKREQYLKDIELAIANEKAKLLELGKRPVEDSNLIVMILSFAYFPLPIGWAFWLGTLQVFDSKNENAGIFCIVLLVFGYFAHHEDKKSSQEHMLKLEPFLIIEKKISELEKKLEWELMKYKY